MKRIANHRVSRKIDHWATFFTVIAILCIVAGVITTIAGLVAGDGTAGIGITLLVSGLMTFATRRLFEGFSLIVRNTEQQLLDNGDEFFYDYTEYTKEEREEMKRKEAEAEAEIKDEK